MSPETAIAVSHKAAELEKALRRVIRGKDDVVLLALDDHRFHRFPLPAIGDSLDLSKPPLVPPPVRLSNAIVPR